jgi:23S rRNA (adenine2503-C2)-methyltransferase
MNIEKLKEILKTHKQPKFRLSQIKKAVFQDGVSSFSEISNLPKNLREILDKEMKILSFEAEKVLVSRDKNSIKALLKLTDGNKIETVLISPKPGDWSACLSSQVGCPLNCAFCATGQTGFKRNLSTEEISDQVLFWKQYLKNNLKLTSVVYMGMGEPFLNWPAVKKSLEILMDKDGLNFGSRSISISTVGVPGGIEKLASDFPQINLAISFHFANDEARKKYMPADNNFNLENLKEDLEKYFEKSNRKVFLEYILFDGLNDGERDAKELIKFIKNFKKSYLLHINLIKYNETSGKFRPSSSKAIQKFKSYLLRNRVGVTIRKSLGTDIQGACGQLAG